MGRKIAYGGILLSLNCIILMLVNVIPINTLFLLGLASLPISIIIMEYGPKIGLIFYIGSTLLSFIIMSNKFQWILYIFTFLLRSELFLQLHIISSFQFHSLQDVQ